MSRRYVEKHTRLYGNVEKVTEGGKVSNNQYKRTKDS